jgi:dihydroxy-acid dehydratase
MPEGGVAVLRGNLCPDGAVMQADGGRAAPAAHRGPAIVFQDYNDMAARIDDPKLGATEDSVLILRSAGPLGAPGMPEWGQLPIPKKLLEQGVRDMVRISDARMSGTSYGALRAARGAGIGLVGGPLALVRDGRHRGARRGGAHADARDLGRRDGQAQGCHGRHPSRTTNAVSDSCISST